MFPGPNNLLAVKNGKTYGLRAALLGGMGRLVAFAIMIAIAASGLVVLLLASENVFLGIKVFGSLYLLYLAYKLWTDDAKVEDVTYLNERKSVKGLARDEFLLAAGNPKAILIFTVFLPQFITSTEHIGLQFAVLGSTFIVLEAVAIALYAAMGIYLRRWFEETKKRVLFNRACSTMFASSGIGMLLSRAN